MPRKDAEILRGGKRYKMNIPHIPYPINLPSMPILPTSSLPQENIPVDLWDTIGAPELPLKLLPKVIEELAFGMAYHMGADASGIAMASLTAAGAAISDKIKLKVKKNDPYWFESARLWTLLIGSPSSKKSPIITSAISPIAQLDSSLIREWRKKHETWAALSKEEKNSIPEPLQQRLRIEDTTVEAAQEVLKGSLDGILCVQDEASGWFGAMERYGGSKSSAADRAFWLRAYEGKEYCLNRIGRGSILIENLSISFIGGIQPDPLRRIVSESQDDGLIQRMIPIVLKHSKVGHDERCPDVQSIYNFSVIALRCLKPVQLKFDEDAQILRGQREEKHLRLMSTELVSSKFASHIGKYDGLFARLCIIWHALENCHKPELPTEITYETAERVSQFMDKFLIPHASCFYSSLGLSDDHDRIKAVAEHILAKKLVTVTVRDVQRGTRAMRKITNSDIMPILQSLVALGWLAEGGKLRPTSLPEFIVNPIVHSIYAERAEKERTRREVARTVMQECFGR